MSAKLVATNSTNYYVGWYGWDNNISYLVPPGATVTFDSLNTRLAPAIITYRNSSSSPQSSTTDGTISINGAAAVSISPNARGNATSNGIILCSDGDIITSANTSSNLTAASVNSTLTGNIFYCASGTRIVANLSSATSDTTQEILTVTSTTYSLLEAEATKYSLSCTLPDNTTASITFPYSVESGNTVSFTLSPADNYTITDLTAAVGTVTCTVSQLTTGSWTVTTPTISEDATLTLTATVEQATFTITCDLPDNTTASVEFPYTIDNGQTLSFTLSPVENYTIDDLSAELDLEVCTVSQLTTGSWTVTTPAISEDSTLTLTATVTEIPQYTVSCTLPNNTTASITFPYTIRSGNTISFTLSPESEYTISSLTATAGYEETEYVYDDNGDIIFDDVDGELVPRETTTEVAVEITTAQDTDTGIWTITTAAITHDTTITLTATTNQITYIVQAFEDTLAISDATMTTSDPVPSGGSYTITYTPVSGYAISKIEYDMVVTDEDGNITYQIVDGEYIPTHGDTITFTENDDGSFSYTWTLTHQEYVYSVNATVEATETPDTSEEYPQFVYIYFPTAEQVQTIADAVWLTGNGEVTTNPLSNILRYERIFDTITPTKLRVFHVGDYSISESVYYTTEHSFTRDLGTISIEPYFNSADDYVATTIRVYVPLYGYASLDPTDCMGHNIGLRYTYELDSGRALAIIYCDFLSPDTILWQGSVNFAVEMTFGTGDVSSYTSSYWTILTAQLGELQPYAIITRKTPASDIIAERGQRVQKIVSLSDVTGYVKFDTIFLSNITATSHEKDEIQRYLTSTGVLVN